MSENQDKLHPGESPPDGTGKPGPTIPVNYQDFEDPEESPDEDEYFSGEEEDEAYYNFRAAAGPEQTPEQSYGAGKEQSHREMDQ